MPGPAVPQPSAPARPRGRAGRAGRAGRIAWRAGWLLLALASMAVTYGVLVDLGR